MSFKLVGDIIGLDLGKACTGVARIHTIARIAQPLDPIQMDDDFVANIEKLVALHKPSALVVGMPRGLDGQTTEQTLWAKEIFESLQRSLVIPVFEIDEAGTTKKAQSRVLEGQSIDSVAAGVFLEDFAAEVTRGGIPNVSI